MNLVTGSTGMLGSHLLLLLCEKGEDVVALKRKTSDLAVVKKTFYAYSSNAEQLLSKINWRNADILDYDSISEAMVGIKYVYHTAAIVSFNPAKKYQTISVNTRGTANVVNAALENKVMKFCHVSSVSALGNSEMNEMVTENTERKPSPNYSGYSISKFNSELEVWRGIAEGLNAVIVNPSVILGAGNWNEGSPSLFKNVWNGMRFYTQGKTGYVYVNDVVELMYKLMHSEFTNQRFIISAENLSYKEIFSKIALALNKDVPSIKANRQLLNIVWRLDKLKSMFTFSKPKITKEIARSADKQTCYSNKKIKEAIPFEFKSIEEAIKEISVRFIKEHNR